MGLEDAEDAEDAEAQLGAFPIFLSPQFSPLAPRMWSGGILGVAAGQSLEVWANIQRLEESAQKLQNSCSDVCGGIVSLQHGHSASAE